MMPDPEFMRACLDETVAEVRSYLKTKAQSKSRRKSGKPIAA
jgi:hypothetical protein